MQSMSWLEDRMQGCRSHCGANPLTCVENSEWLTQYGQVDGDKPAFRNNAKPTAPGMSVQRGVVSPEGMCDLVYGERVTSENYEAAVTRQATAESLRAVGFAVVHTPTLAGFNHASVVRLGADDLIDETTPWSDDVTELFDSCFNE